MRLTQTSTRQCVFFPSNKLAESRGVDNKVRLPQLEISRRVLDAALLAHSLSLSFSHSLSFLSLLIRKALWKDEVGRNQNKWILLKPAMHQPLDKVINKQLRMVID